MIRAALLTALLLSAPVLAQSREGFGPGPVLPDVGPIAPVDSDLALPKGAKFKIAFDVAAKATPGGISRQIETAARTLNMHVAAGVPFGDLGSPLDASLLVPAAALPIEAKAGELHTVVRIVDGFGTLVLAGDRSDITTALGALEPSQPLRITVGDQKIETVWANRFGDVAEHDPLCYIDSAGRLALAVNRGSAAERYGATRRTPVVITRA